MVETSHLTPPICPDTEYGHCLQMLKFWCQVAPLKLRAAYKAVKGLLIFYQGNWQPGPNGTIWPEDSAISQFIHHHYKMLPSSWNIFWVFYAPLPTDKYCVILKAYVSCPPRIPELKALYGNFNPHISETWHSWELEKTMVWNPASRQNWPILSCRKWRDKLSELCYLFSSTSTLWQVP